MQNNSDEILKELVSIFKINLERANVYKKLLGMKTNNKLNNHFQEQLNDSNQIVEELDLIINSAVDDDEKKVLFDDFRLNQSQFYFGMAQNSNNLRTIIVSCKLGDEYLKNIYQSSIQFFDFKPFPKLNKFLTKHIESTQSMIQILESIFINNKLAPF
jgi:ferritin-like metal-binding protein YciE